MRHWRNLATQQPSKRGRMIMLPKKQFKDVQRRPDNGWQYWKLAKSDWVMNLNHVAFRLGSSPRKLSRAARTADWQPPNCWRQTRARQTHGRCKSWLRERLPFDAFDFFPMMAHSHKTQMKTKTKKWDDSYHWNRYLGTPKCMDNILTHVCHKIGSRLHKLKLLVAISSLTPWQFTKATWSCLWAK